jgi:hypothetical protein
MTRFLPLLLVLASAALAVAPVGGQPGPKAPDPGPFPRRLLFIHVSNYLYLNPLTATGMSGGAKGPDLTRAAANRLGYEWRVPSEQVYLVPDTAAPPHQRIPMKRVITGAYEQFFATSRAQDRIVVYFGGHVLHLDGKTYLAPVEGDPGDAATLIPLDHFYDKLKACKATQKVVVWDVCRFNPERGRHRPGSEPMTPEVAKALAAAPPGVQVVLTCQPGENALEFDNLQPDGPNKVGIPGSSFLEASRYAARQAKPGAKAAEPNDPIPVEAWAGAVGGRVNEMAAFSDPKAKQTIKVVGKRPEQLIAFDPKEPPAKRFDLPTPPKGAPVADIVAEFALPGIKTDDGASDLATFPFPEEAVAPYRADVPPAEILKPANAEKYKFRLAVIEAFETMRKAWSHDAGFGLRAAFIGPNTAPAKKAIAAEQDGLATIIVKLEREITRLEEVAALRGKEPKRWQAHYDYALAQALTRLAFLHEYNLMLAHIRTENLPDLDPAKRQDGYKLVAVDQLTSKGDVRRLARQAKELFTRIIADHKGTPWAVQARRDRDVPLGLKWEPFNSKGAKEGAGCS